jgi:putative Holliday junction resolvase
MTDQKNSECVRILSIDYGEKRIGLALTDPLCLFAYPLKTLDNDSKLWSNLTAEIKAHSVEKIVVGFPLKEDGTKSEFTLKVEKFIEELKRRTKLIVVPCDERYSSEIAKKKIIESVKSKKKRRDKGLVDRNAAAEILTDYLNSIHH